MSVHHVADAHYLPEHNYGEEIRPTNEPNGDEVNAQVHLGVCLKFLELVFVSNCVQDVWLDSAH